MEFRCKLKLQGAIILLTFYVFAVKSNAQSGDIPIINQQIKLTSLKKSDQLLILKASDSLKGKEIATKLMIESESIIAIEKISETLQYLVLEIGAKYGNPKKRKIEKAAEELSGKIHPIDKIDILKLNETTDLIIRNEFILQFKDSVTRDDIENYFSSQNHISQRVPDLYVANRYLVSYDDYKGAKTYDDIARKVELDKRVDFIEGNIRELTNSSDSSHPLIPTEIAPMPIEWPNDKLLNTQWYLRNTGIPTDSGLPDADIKIFDGWRISQGQGVLIAIIDNGLESNHPEFKDKVVGNYDAFNNVVFSQPDSLEFHGTACAGIAGALGGNNEGICGIAPRSKLLGVKIAQTSRLNSWKTEAAVISRGIIWAADNNAKIINCSWGSSRSNKAITKAIRYASGKGCIIICAAGNDGSGIEFPASLSKDMDAVISVGASNSFNEFKTTNCRDTEKTWGSCFGKSLTIVAPGVALVTTDLLNERGNNRNGDYVVFSGTSAATPIVSGAIALMLSKNPNLTAVDVKRYIDAFSDTLKHDSFSFNHLNVKKLLDGVMRDVPSDSLK